AELKPGRPRQYDWKSSCETWSVAFSPDGTWFAWSQGHCIVKLIPWPLEEAELCKTLDRKSHGSKAEARRGGGAKQKTLECGQIVWGLAFSSWPAADSGDLDGTCAVGLACLILATGLNDGQIKVWEVQTGHLLFSLLGHQDVVRDLSFAPNGSLILVSASRDKTLRVWDLSRDGRQVQVLVGHVQWVYCCSISPDCSMLCSAAGEKSVSPGGWEPVPRPTECSAPFGPPVSHACSPGPPVPTATLRPSQTPACTPGTQMALGPGGLFSVGGTQVFSFSRSCFEQPPWLSLLCRAVPVAPMTNGLCCMYFPHGGFIATGTRDGHVQFWTAPRVLSSLKHLCRKALRTFLTTYQVLALPIPRKLKEFLTYRTF
ncbi:WD repeat and SOCS box-containing protein 2, partial [Struthio camelus australis]